MWVVVIKGHRNECVTTVFLHILVIELKHGAWQLIVSLCHLISLNMPQKQFTQFKNNTLFCSYETDVLANRKRGNYLIQAKRKCPKCQPDNRRPVIIRIDGTNLLLMIRKMRSSRPHFKYIFHYQGPDKLQRWFHHQSRSLPLVLAQNYSSTTSPNANVSFWLNTSCPKLNAFVLRQDKSIEACHGFVILLSFIWL